MYCVFLNNNYIIIIIIRSKSWNPNVYCGLDDWIVPVCSHLDMDQ